MILTFLHRAMEVIIHCKRILSKKCSFIKLLFQKLYKAFRNMSSAGVTSVCVVRNLIQLQINVHTLLKKKASMLELFLEIRTRSELVWTFVIIGIHQLSLMYLLLDNIVMKKFFHIFVSFSLMILTPIDTGLSWTN